MDKYNKDKNIERWSFGKSIFFVIGIFDIKLIPSQSGWPNLISCYPSQ